MEAAANDVGMIAAMLLYSGIIWTQPKKNSQSESAEVWTLSSLEQKPRSAGCYVLTVTSRFILAWRKGFEPLTYGLEGRCCYPLS